MKLKDQNKLLIDTLAAVYPLIGRGFITVGTTMMSGKNAVTKALLAVGALEEPKEPGDPPTKP